MTHVPGPATENRFADRPLNQRGTRHDICPDCGGERDELLIARDLFYCESCKTSGLGPNAEAPAVDPAQTLFSVSDVGSHVEMSDGRGGTIGVDDIERPPIDEGMAWVGEEGPDE